VLVAHHNIGIQLEAKTVLIPYLQQVRQSAVAAVAVLTDTIQYQVAQAVAVLAQII
jgi:hypothetical protein